MMGTLSVCDGDDRLKALGSTTQSSNKPKGAAGVKQVIDAQQRNYQTHQDKALKTGQDAAKATAAASSSQMAKGAAALQQKKVPPAQQTMPGSVKSGNATSVPQTMTTSGTTAPQPVARRVAESGGMPVQAVNLQGTNNPQKAQTSSAGMTAKQAATSATTQATPISQQAQKSAASSSKQQPSSTIPKSSSLATPSEQVAAQPTQMAQPKKAALAVSKQISGQATVKQTLPGVTNGKNDPKQQLQNLPSPPTINNPPSQQSTMNPVAAQAVAQVSGGKTAAQATTVGNLVSNPVKTASVTGKLQGSGGNSREAQSAGDDLAADSHQAAGKKTTMIGNAGTSQQQVVAKAEGGATTTAVAAPGHQQKPTLQQDQLRKPAASVGSKNDPSSLQKEQEVVQDPNMMLANKTKMPVSSVAPKAALKQMAMNPADKTTAAQGTTTSTPQVPSATLTMSDKNKAMVSKTSEIASKDATASATIAKAVPLKQDSKKAPGSKTTTSQGPQPSAAAAVTNKDVQVQQKGHQSKEEAKDQTMAIGAGATTAKLSAGVNLKPTLLSPTAGSGKGVGMSHRPLLSTPHSPSQMSMMEKAIVKGEHRYAPNDDLEEALQSAQDLEITESDLQRDLQSIASPVSSTVLSGSNRVHNPFKESGKSDKLQPGVNLLDALKQLDTSNKHSTSGAKEKEKDMGKKGQVLKTDASQKKQQSLKMQVAALPGGKLDIETEVLEGDLRYMIEGLAQDVLVDRTLNSTTLVFNILSFIDAFKGHPKTQQKLNQLLSVLQPGSDVAAKDGKDDTGKAEKDFQEVKEWLKQYLVKEIHERAFHQRVIDGEVVMAEDSDHDQDRKGVKQVVEKPKPKPKEYVDQTELANVLKSVFQFKFKQTQQQQQPAEEKKTTLPKKDGLRPSSSATMPKIDKKSTDNPITTKTAAEKMGKLTIDKLPKPDKPSTKTDDSEAKKAADLKDPLKKEDKKVTESQESSKKDGKMAKKPGSDSIKDKENHDPLRFAENRAFSVEFLTKFILKGYCGGNKVDLTGSELPHKDKNLLKWAGVATETIPGGEYQKVKAIQPTEELEAEADADHCDDSDRVNKFLYKTLFSSFTIRLKLLSLKRLITGPIDGSGEVSRLPNSFKVRFKFFNFSETLSERLFLDPLAPLESQIIPILVQTQRQNPESCEFNFTIENDLERFVDFMYGQKLRLYFYTSQSDLLFAMSEIDLNQVLSCHRLFELFQVPLYKCQDPADKLTQPIAHLQFATMTGCEPIIELPQQAPGKRLEDQGLEDPILRIRSRGNLNIGTAKVILSDGTKPTMEEFVKSTEMQQLRTVEQVRKKVRVGASKYMHQTHFAEASNPFAALQYGDEYFLKRWLIESEFQRQSMKQQAIKDRIYQGNSEMVPFKVYAGEPHYFNVMARNEENYDQTFKLEIFDQSLPLGADQPDLNTLPIRVITEKRDQEYLEKKEELERCGATKCVDLSVFMKLKDGKLLVTLGPRKSSNLLVKYLSIDGKASTYLIRLTKLVDKYDLGHSYQIKVNEEDEESAYMSSSPQNPFHLPPDQIMHVYHDVTKPFQVVNKAGEKFAENTRIFPSKVIARKPDGTIGSSATDKMLKLDRASSFQVFEYGDPDRHYLRKVTLLVVEPVSRLTVSLSKKSSTFQGTLDLYSPPEKDVFTVKCKYQATDDTRIEIGSIVPGDQNNRGEPITHWNVPVKITYVKPKVEIEDSDDLFKQVFLSFIDATSAEKKGHMVFAKHVLSVDLTGQHPEFVKAKKKPVAKPTAAAQKQPQIGKEDGKDGTGEAASENQEGQESDVGQAASTVQVLLDKPGAKTIVHEYMVAGQDTARSRELKLTSSRPNLLKLIGPSTRKCKAGGTLKLKLMFINRADKRVTANSAPIKMYIYANEIDDSFNDNDDDDENGEDGYDFTTAEEDPDQVSDKITFEVAYVQQAGAAV